MTKIECIKMVLKYLRGMTTLCVCCVLGKICVKVNSKADLTTLRRWAISAYKDIMDAAKAFGLNELYEDFKRIYDEIYYEL